MSTDDRPAGRVQSVRNAWINALRDETLRVRSTEMARVAHVGHMIATYADADGGNAFPSRETLAALVGGTTETVTRAVKVLTAAGVLTTKRRPNAPSVYQLLMPVVRPNWAEHMPLYTETRQKRDRAARKKREFEEWEQTRTASGNAVRTASQAGYPDSVPGGVSGQRPRTPSGDSDSVAGRPRTASEDAIRTASQAGGTSTDLPPVGTQSDDQDPVEPEPQPQVRVGARGENDQSPPTPPERPGWTHCTTCEGPMLIRPDRTTHAHCTDSLERIPT